MCGRVEMFGGMLVFRRIATADVATDHAEAEVDPNVTDLEALFADAGGWSDGPNLIQVCAGLHFCSLRARAMTVFARQRFQCLCNDPGLCSAIEIERSVGESGGMKSSPPV